MCTVIFVFLALLFLEFDEYIGDDVMMLVEVVMHMATMRTSEKRSQRAHVMSSHHNGPQNAFVD